uniref:Uncharacterized protein n=1 Tax=Avena sativa TaxID=4498 RepID=A0ACD5TSM8_AVESA
MVKPHSLNNRKPFSTPHSQCFVLQPQIQPMEEGAGMPPRRSASLHPQIQPSGDSAGASSRHSPCLYPQIQAIEEGAGVTCRRSRGTSRAAAASLPDDDGMLWEILLRLPPQPSSLPRASAVCKRWRCIVGDPKFHRQFYAHHRKPPLLGVFECNFQRIVFTPVLDPPNHIPPQRFDLGRYSSGLPYRQLLDCRHGRILIEDRVQKEVIVCDPITGDQRRLTIPLEFKRHFFNGSVLCAAGDQGHVHGGCHSSPFKVVLMSICKDTQPIASVYSSENGLWGNLISAETRCEISRRHAVLVSNRLYWVSMDDGILEFDLGDHSLTVIKGPPVTNDIISLIHSWIIQAEHGAVGYAILSYSRFHM